MASNTSLYGSTSTTSNVGSNNFTTLYSPGAGVVRTQLPYGNSNVVSLLNIGTDSGNTITNIVATGTVTSNNVNTPTVYSQGMAVQGYDFVQMQYSNAVTLPVSPYDIGTGSWFYLDSGGATFQSNTTGSLTQIVLGNDGNVTANYFIGNITGTSNTANYANYANLANYANVASTANSVNIANVVGIGNIATTNYDGNSSNILYGNGGFYALPNSNVALANFANYAGNVTVSNQPNITQVGSLVNLNVVGNTLTNNLTVNLQLSGNIANFVGNITSANANLGNIVIANYFSGDGSLLTNINGSNVSNVANANYANFAGTAYSVNGSNVTGTVANANYSAYAGQADTANLATFATTANSVAGANVSGIVANANYAAYAGNVSNVTPAGSNTQIQFNVSNTSLGASANLTFDTTTNLLTTSNATLGYASVLNSNSTTQTTLVINPSAPNIGIGAGSNSFFTQMSYGSNNSPARSEAISVIKARGNSAVPTVAANGDISINIVGYIYTPNGPKRTGSVAIASPFAANTSFTGPNTYWTPGSFNMIAGSQNGNIANANSLTNQNLLAFTYQGNELVIPGTYGANTGIIQIWNYGSNSDSTFGPGSQLILSRVRGNRDSNVAISTGDTLGTISFQGYTGGGGFQRGAGIIANANGTITSGATFATDMTLFTSNSGYINIGNTSTTGNFVVNYTSTFVGNIVANTNANIGNLQLNQFQENVYSYGNASGTVTPDFANGSIQSLTLTGNITLNSLSNAVNGRSMTLILTQDATGNRTLSSTWKYAGGYKTLSTAPGAQDIISLVYVGSTTYASLTTGYA